MCNFRGYLTCRRLRVLKKIINRYRGFQLTWNHENPCFFFLLASHVYINIISIQRFNTISPYCSHIKKERLKINAWCVKRLLSQMLSEMAASRTFCIKWWCSVWLKAHSCAHTHARSTEIAFPSRFITARLLATSRIALFPWLDRSVF